MTTKREKTTTVAATNPETEIKSLKKIIAALKTANKKKDEQIKDLKDELSLGDKKLLLLEKEASKAQDANAKLTKEMSKTKDKLALAEESIAELEAKLSHATKKSWLKRIFG